MAEISASAAKEQVLNGTESVKRMSADAVAEARNLGHEYLKQLGKKAESEAQSDGRKTIMPQDLRVAARLLTSAGDTTSESQAPASSYNIGGL